MHRPPDRSDVAARLWRYAREWRGLIALAAVSVIVRALTEPALMRYLTDLLEALRAGQGTMDALTATVGWMVLFGLLMGLSDFAHMFLFDYVGQRVIQRLRGDLFARLQNLSLSYFEDARTGVLLSRATNDIQVVQARLNFELSRLVKCPLTISGLLAVMLWASWRLTLISFGVIAVLVPLVSTATRLMRRHTAQVQDRLADLSAHMTESLAAIRVVQCFGATDHEVALFDAENAEVRRAAMRTVRVRSVIEPFIHSVGLIGLLLMLWIGGWFTLVLHTVSPERLLVLLGCLQMITTNFKQLGRARLALAEIIAAGEKVFQVIDTESDITDKPTAEPLRDVEGRVTFEHVSFSYRSGKQVLDDIDLELAPGEAVAVVGASGAGKSTLANLIPRLYDATAGRVLIDGQDVRDITLESLRSHIGIVPQETVLFRGTLRDNIAYGRPGASVEEIQAAAVAANADQFIRELPDGYDTQAGERGKKLSGGQAQRVAIARAILRDPRILILDEATSSLDSASEALVQEALERLMRDRTTLVIAHRLSTIQNADRIVVLEAGRVIECGTHAELLARGGHYQRAYLLQAGERAPAAGESAPAAGESAPAAGESAHAAGPSAATEATRAS